VLPVSTRVRKDIRFVRLLPRGVVTCSVTRSAPSRRSFRATRTTGPGFLPGPAPGSLVDRDAGADASVVGSPDTLGPPSGCAAAGAGTVIATPPKTTPKTTPSTPAPRPDKRVPVPDAPVRVPHPMITDGIVRHII